MLNGPPTERQNFCCAKSSAGASRGEYCPKSKSIEKEVAVGLADFVNSWIIAHLHIAAAHRAALRDLGNTPSALPPERGIYAASSTEQTGRPR